jgi:hypothetical protein
MSCNADVYHRLNRPLEKLEVLTRLSPCLDSDEETAYTLSVLMSVIADYAQDLRAVLNDLATETPGEEASL